MTGSGTDKRHAGYRGGVRPAAPQSFDRVVSSIRTEPHPAAREAAERFYATDPGDPEY